MAQRWYRITVDGVLSDRFAAAFAPMRLEAHDGVTVLSGPCTDASALYGVIEQLRNLGLDLLDVRSDDPASTISG
jgi:hypothetical protein